jgi:2-desacetyl-2-hydroxyethyl bacteriochlorophyllide A dehydrogenase
VRAAVLIQPGTFELADLPEPHCAADEVIVRVSTCGICGTDRAIFRGEAPAAWPVVLGHEFSGVIVEVGSQVTGLSVGDRVAADPNVVDGTCFFCRRGETNLCSGLSPLGIRRNGGFAEFAAVPATNAYRLPETVSVEDGSLVEPLACCVRGIDQATIGLGDLVAVLGAGPIGCLLIQLAHIQGAGTILAVEPDEARRHHAIAAGADLTCGPDEAVALLKELRNPSADVVIEASGRTQTAEWALGLVRRGGTVVLFGVYPEQEKLSVNPFSVNEDELRIVGSLNNPNTNQRAIDLLASGRVVLDGVITHRLSLEELPKAMDRDSFPGAGKITVDPQKDAVALAQSAAC